MEGAIPPPTHKHLHALAIFELKSTMIAPRNLSNKKYFNMFTENRQYYTLAKIKRFFSVFIRKVGDVKL